MGFTAATPPADIGLFGLTQACQAEFPGSRFCTLPDIFNTTTIPDLAVGTPLAWVEPGLARSSASGDPTILERCPRTGGLALHRPGREMPMARAQRGHPPANVKPGGGIGAALIGAQSGVLPDFP